MPSTPNLYRREAASVSSRVEGLPWNHLFLTCDDGATDAALGLEEGLSSFGLPLESWFPPKDMSGCGGCLGFCSSMDGSEPISTPVSYFRRAWKRGSLGIGTLCIVGPNAGINGPADVLWSGTVMAAAYAASKGASAVAISCEPTQLGEAPEEAVRWILEEQPFQPGLWMLDLTGAAPDWSQETPWDSMFVWRGRSTR